MLMPIETEICLNEAAILALRDYVLTTHPHNRRRQLELLDDVKERAVEDLDVPEIPWQLTMMQMFAAVLLKMAVQEHWPLDATPYLMARLTPLVRSCVELGRERPDGEPDAVDLLLAEMPILKQQEGERNSRYLRRVGLFVEDALGIPHDATVA